MSIDIGSFGVTKLFPKRADEVLQQLKKFMIEAKPFLRGDLTLPGLAKELGMSTHHLSQVINEKLQQTFFEFVNYYTVNELHGERNNPGNKKFAASVKH